MDSLTFTPGHAFLSSNSPAVPWTAVFEDEGPAGYFYACDRSQETHDHAIMDSMLIYSKGSLKEPEREYLAAVQWSKDGQQCVLYLDGSAQALIDFAARESFCRSDFPNFMGEQGGGGWRTGSHEWNQAALERFEAAVYA
jgi:hypothetical protein